MWNIEWNNFTDNAVNILTFFWHVSVPLSFSLQSERLTNWTKTFFKKNIFNYFQACSVLHTTICISPDMKHKWSHLDVQSLLASKESPVWFVSDPKETEAPVNFWYFSFVVCCMLPVMFIVSGCGWSEKGQKKINTIKLWQLPHRVAWWPSTKCLSTKLELCAILLLLKLIKQCLCKQDFWALFNYQPETKRIFHNSKMHKIDSQLSTKAVFPPYYATNLKKSDFMKYLTYFNFDVGGKADLIN